MSTVETIQANLKGFGLILWPGSPDDPPTQIDDACLHRSELRFYVKPNPNGPVFDYRYSPQHRRWILEDAEDSG